MSPYLRLMRLDKPIGIWLLLLPCWWSLALAGAEVWRGLWLALLFAAGALVMRGAGCIVNDMADRKLDAAVERTRNRPLASGEVKIWQAAMLLAALLLIGLGILSRFNEFTIVLGVASLPLVFTYPLMKRITWWPQLFLGLTFNWGALMGWSAARGALDWPPLWLYLAGVFWTLAYDTIYAHQDAADDARAGIKSSALRLGKFSRVFVGGCMVATLALMALAGTGAGMGGGFFATLIVAGAYAFLEIRQWKPDNAADCLRRFQNHGSFGLMILIGLLLGRAL